MSIIDTIAHALQEHATRAAREGKQLESNFVTLIKEIVMSSIQDIQSQVTDVKTKLGQVEADVGALVAKSGGTTPPASGVAVTQDQLDSVGAGLTDVAARLDALNTLVLNGPPTSTSTPAPEPTPAPAITTSVPPPATPIPPATSPPVGA